MTSCKHAIPLPQVPDGSIVACGIGETVNPGAAYCARCERYDGSPRGLGDTFKAVIDATGIGAVVKAIKGGDCKPCQKRRARLNAAVPFTKES